MDHGLHLLELPRMDVQWGIINRWEEMIIRLEEQRVRRPRRIVVDRMDPFQAMTEAEFVERFRIRKNTAQDLINNLEDQLAVAANQRGKSKSSIYG